MAVNNTAKLALHLEPSEEQVLLAATNKVIRATANVEQVMIQNSCQRHDVHENVSSKLWSAEDQSK